MFNMNLGQTLLRIFLPTITKLFIEPNWIKTNSGEYTPPEPGSFGDKASKWLSNLGNLVSDAADSAGKQFLGTGLTGAQKEANAFTAEREDLAWQRSFEADSTKYQRTVNDMRAAGINPMSLTGSISAAPSYSGASSVSTPAGGLANLGSILSLMMEARLLPARIKDLEASAQNKMADAANKTEDTRGSKLANDFFADTTNIRSVLLSDQHERNIWEKDVAQRDASTRAGMLSVEQQKASHYNDYLDKQADFIQEQIKSKDLERALLRANAREANVNASYKAAMLEVDKRIGEASEEKTREELELLKIESRLKRGIYDEKTIAMIARAAQADASAKIVAEAYQRGDYKYASRELQKMFHKLEKNGELPAEAFSYGSFYSHSTNGPASASALPY